MFSELKSLSNLFIVFSVISCIFSVYILKPLSWSDSVLLSITCIYIAISIPAIFISLAVALRKIAAELSAKHSTIYENLRQLEDKLDE